MSEIKSLIRFGVVSSVDASKCTARVTFADRDNLVSAELPVLQGVGLKNKSYMLPDVNESVVCLMFPNSDDGSGVILGSFYHDKAAPPTTNQDESMIRFADNTSISYNRATHELKIDCVGDVRINAKHIFLNC